MVIETRIENENDSREAVRNVRLNSFMGIYAKTSITAAAAAPAEGIESAKGLRRRVHGEQNQCTFCGRGECE